MPQTLYFMYVYSSDNDYINYYLMSSFNLWFSHTIFKWVDFKDYSHSAQDKIVNNHDYLIDVTRQHSKSGELKY